MLPYIRNETQSGMRKTTNSKKSNQTSGHGKKTIDVERKIQAAVLETSERQRNWAGGGVFWQKTSPMQCGGRQETAPPWQREIQAYNTYKKDSTVGKTYVRHIILVDRRYKSAYITTKNHMASHSSIRYHIAPRTTTQHHTVVPWSSLKLLGFGIHVSLVS